MANALKLNLEGIASIPDPTTESGEIFLFPEAFGQDGQPFVIHVEDPPNKTRARHHHHDDVLYVYTKGEHHIEGEGTYRPGDIRWTRKGHVYGPETTGPEGGAWWVISYSDPIPVDETEDVPTSLDDQSIEADSGQLPHFTRPYDWDKIDRVVQTIGGVILEGFLTSEELTRLDGGIDDYLQSHSQAGKPESSSTVYDMFLGKKTIRLHGLLDKVPQTELLIGHNELVESVERLISPMASSVLLNAGELIQIQPGEPAQFPHRDTDSWPELPNAQHPILINGIVALDAFTLENGATYVAPDSWQWQEGRQPKSEEFARAVMDRGDMLLFRGDLIHGGGENTSDKHRRALSISYCAGWLRPVENSFLNLSKETVAKLPIKLQALLGYTMHDATHKSGGLVGLYENGDPARALDMVEPQ